MNNFKNLLTLSYFYQYKNKYSLFELQKVLGITIRQFEKILFFLLDEKLLEYQANLLTITAKGANIVISRNMESFPFEISDKEQIFESTIKIERLGIEDIYIPKNFLKKLGA